MPSTTDESVRFWSKVAFRDDGCWEFVGAIRPDGYGAFRVAGRTELAHRYAYVALNGPIAAGLTLDHLCCFRACVNATEHLEEVTLAENKRRGMSANAVNARKTHCLNGHEFTPENTIFIGSRRCRVCKNAVDARARAARTPEQIEATRIYMRDYHAKRKRLREQGATL